MKRGSLIFLLVFIAAVIAGTIYTIQFLYDQEQQADATYPVEHASLKDIAVTTVAPGSIQPRREILIKPQISGIVREVLVEAGDHVRKGDVLARVTVIPSMGAVSNAQSRLEQARIRLKDAEANYDRNNNLLAAGVISDAAFQVFETALSSAQEEELSAADNLKIIEEGVTSRNSAVSNTLIRSTIDGMVLDVPVKQGNSVIEANNFNEGTTIASIANMRDLMFIGKIDESEVENLAVGMAIELSIGAIEGENFPAHLEYISPKGVDEMGAIQFEIKAAVELAEGDFLRAGYSANANVVLASREQVLSLSEAWVQYDGNQGFAEVLIAPDTYERRDLILGLSDGLTVEVISGIVAEDEIKVWNQPKYE
jgi:HlyD family secretion protein